MRCGMEKGEMVTYQTMSGEGKDNEERVDDSHCELWR